MKQKALSAAVADPLRTSPRDSPAVSVSGKAAPSATPGTVPGVPRAAGHRLPQVIFLPDTAGFFLPLPSLSQASCAWEDLSRARCQQSRFQGCGGPGSSSGLSLVAGVAGPPSVPPTVARVSVSALAAWAVCSWRVSHRPCDTCFLSLSLCLSRL